MPEMFTMREQRIVVRYLKVQNTATEEIHRLLTVAAGPLAASYKEVRNWVQDIQDGIEDPDKCVCIASLPIGNNIKQGPTDPALICRIENIINYDRRITTEKVSEFSLSTEFGATQILNNILGLRRVCEKWIPKAWTPDQRTFRVSVCKELLDMYNYGGVDFLSKLIVGDETLACYYKNEGSRRTSRVEANTLQVTPGSRRASRAEGGALERYRPANEPTQVHCMFFYDAKGLLISELMPEGQYPTPEFYASMLKTILLPILKRKRGHNDKQAIYLLHDNIALHNSIHFQEVQKELNIIVLPHPTNSPDMEPHEYWFFKQLKSKIGNSSFKSRADVYTTLNHHANDFIETDFANSINQLPDRWSRIIDNDGLYILN